MSKLTKQEEKALNAAIQRIREERDTALREIAEFEDAGRREFHTHAAHASTTMRVALERWRANSRVTGASTLAGVFSLLAMDLVEAATLNYSDNPVERAGQVAQLFNNFIQNALERGLLVAPHQAAQDAAVDLAMKNNRPSLIDAQGLPLRKPTKH